MLHGPSKILIQNLFLLFDVCSLLLFLFHKYCWFIDYENLFDVYSFDILSIFYVFVNSSSVFKIWIYIVIFTHVFMVCFESFRNLQVNSFSFAIYSSN